MKDIAGMTPLHYAAAVNAHEMEALLLQKGADVNADDKFGNTPLHFERLLGSATIKMTTDEIMAWTRGEK